MISIKQIKLTKALSIFGVVVLIALAFSGVLDNRAHAFVERVLKNNLDLVASVESLQLLMTGVGSVKVPFLSSYADKIVQDLTQVEGYLMLATVLNFAQLILIAISKSVLLDIALLVLFVLTFVPKLKRISTKYLIIALAINPGLFIYTVVLQEVSKHASIDFGDKYVVELRADIDTMMVEKTQLMNEHAQALTRISNGEMGIEPLRRLKEDVSYDLKKAKVSLTGDYKKLRYFLRDAGYEITSNVIGFFTMILITMLLLPIGYFFLVYLLYTELFKSQLDINQLVASLKNATNTVISEQSQPH